MNWREDQRWFYSLQDLPLVVRRLVWLQKTCPSQSMHQLFPQTKPSSPARLQRELRLHATNEW